MRAVQRTTLGILFAVALAALVGGVAEARTPTPTSTPTATPAPPQPALYSIRPWINAQNQGQVTARIGSTLCATGAPFAIPSDPEPRSPSLQFTVSVPSEEALPGCGREGAIVTFFIDGQQARPTAIWHPGDNGIFGVIAGPPFADFFILSGEAEQTSRAGGSLVPYIGDTPCGRTGIVYSDQQVAGCGVEGSQITFKLFDSQGNLIGTANEKGTWHAWDGVGDDVQGLNLTFGSAASIHMGNVGGGPESGNAWLRLSLALASLGPAGAVAGFALRRRLKR